jgi:hypothetical protein
LYGAGDLINLSQARKELATHAEVSISESISFFNKFKERYWIQTLSKRTPCRKTAHFEKSEEDWVSATPSPPNKILPPEYFFARYPGPLNEKSSAGSILTKH